MNQLLINVFCPPVSKSYDFWIPAKMKVQTAIDLLCDDICFFEENSNLFINRSELLLCSYLEKKPLSPELTMAQAGIKSGDILALI